jgi:hypothetical protein
MQDSEALGMKQLSEYETFVDKIIGDTASLDYKKPRCHKIYDTSQSSCHRSRLVASIHLTDQNTDSVNFGVVSLQCIYLVTFLSKLNNLELILEMNTLKQPPKQNSTLLVVVNLVQGNIKGTLLIMIFCSLLASTFG